MGMGLIFSALSGAGQGAAQVGAEQQKVLDEKDLLNARSDAELMKAKAIADYTNQLQNAPTNRAGAILQSVSGQDAQQPQVGGDGPTKPIPVQPNETPVSNATGNPLVDSVAKREGLSPTQAQVMSALLHQESNNGKNAVTSTDGAIGAGQIMPATFAQYARKGESISNPADNLAVMARIVKDLGSRSGDDPAKIATGYFSGPGNMNLADDAKTDWVHDHADGNGKRVSSYVKDVLGRIASADASQTSGSDQGSADTTTIASGGAPAAVPSGASQQANPLQLAYQKAIATGDLQAAAILKGMIPDKTIKLGDGETLLDAATNRPIFSNTGKSDRQDKQIAMQTKLEQMKEDNRNALEAKKLDPLGLNGSTTVAQPIGGSMGKRNTDMQLGPAAQAIKDGLHGDDLLAAVPTTIASQVKALSEGRMAFPSGFAMKTPYWQEMTSLVSQYDPSFDAANFNKRNQTAVAFSKGKQADAVRAANQTIAHMGSLYDTIDKLDNFGGMATPLNYIVNPIESAFGDARQGTFKMQAQAVASELRKVFSGSGGGSLQELKSWEESLPVNASQTQQKAYLQSGSHLLQGAIDALDNQYKQGMGTVADRVPLISPKAQSMLNKIQGNADNTQSAQAEQSNSIPDGWSVKVH